MLFIKQLCNIDNTDFADRLAEYEDISPDIANRFAGTFTGSDTITEFAMKVKSKEYSIFKNMPLHYAYNS